MRPRPSRTAKISEGAQGCMFKYVMFLSILASAAVMHAEISADHDGTAGKFGILFMLFVRVNRRRRIVDIRSLGRFVLQKPSSLRFRAGWSSTTRPDVDELSKLQFLEIGARAFLVFCEFPYCASYLEA